MFSESISDLVSKSSFSSAQARIAQIEKLVANYTDSIQKTESTQVQFSDYLKAKPETELKFKVVPPLPVSKGEVQNLVEKVANKYNLDKGLLISIIKQESNFNPNAVSSAGAKGLMQLMPNTARGLGVDNPFDPAQNIEGGAKLLKGLLDKYRGNLVLALAAYNAGSGNVDKYGGVPPFKETQNYVRRILSNYLDKTNV